MSALVAFVLAGAVALGAPATGNWELGTVVRSPGSLFPGPGTQSVPQSPVPSPEPPVSGSELTISLLTMGFGDQIWERFGHNAIRIVDSSRGTDDTYHWGSFDFDQPNFLTRFMTGNTLYWMVGVPMAETMAQYRERNRSVWEQELDLTPAERVAVRDFIAWNAREENRYYRYDYYLDNCSTRVRDVIDRVVGGQLKIAMAPRLTSTTYRFHTQRLLQFDRAVALGTNIGLGEGADRPISQWEEAFLPARLQEHLRAVQVRGADGTLHSLVKSEQQLFAASRPPEPVAPPNTLIRNLLIGLGVAVVIGLLAHAAMSGRRAPRIAFVTAATIWSVLSGLLGVILIVGWTATKHTFMVRNENLLQFDPLSLGLAIVLPLAMMRGRSVGTARWLAKAIAVIAIIGLAIKLIPLFMQTNVAIIALTLPVHLVVAWAVRTLSAIPVQAPPRRSAPAAAMSRSAA